VQLQLNFAIDCKKGFYRYVSKRGRSKKVNSPLLSKTGKLVTTNEEKPGVLNNFFGNLSSHTSRVDGQQDGD